MRNDFAVGKFLSRCMYVYVCFKESENSVLKQEVVSEWVYIAGRERLYSKTRFRADVFNV